MLSLSQYSMITLKEYMLNMTKIAVTSRSFSKHPQLRKILADRYDDIKFNDDGLALKGDALIEYLQGYDKAITALEVIDDYVLSRLPDLKVIGKYGVGLDMIDLQAMKKYNVLLGWQGGVNKRSVSELVLSFSICLLHRTVFANMEVRDGEWYQVKGRQLTGCTVGIVGCGHIGKDVVKLLKPFGCKILAHDIRSYPDFYADNNVMPTTLDELLRKSDVVTLHLPLDKSTMNILGLKELKLMRKDAVLINLARGGLIDEDALKQQLKAGCLGGVALDVFNVEPPVDRELISMDNVLVTPHIGGSTEEAILAMGIAAIDGLEQARDPLEFQ